MLQIPPDIMNGPLNLNCMYVVIHGKGLAKPVFIPWLHLCLPHEWVLYKVVPNQSQRLATPPLLSCKGIYPREQFMPTTRAPVSAICTAFTRMCAPCIKGNHMHGYIRIMEACCNFARF